MIEARRRLAVARGDEPADVVVRGRRVFSVSTRERPEVDVDRFQLVPFEAGA